MRGQVKVYQKKIVAKKRRRLFYFSLYGFVALGLIVSALSYISQIDALSLREVSVRGNVRMMREDVDGIVRARLAGNYGFLFSRANALLYPREEITADLSLLPLIKTVEVSRSGFNTVVVTMTERDEIAHWCNHEEVGDPSCFSVDENGLVFAPVLTRFGSSTVFTYSGFIPDGPLGKQVLPTPDFKKMEFFIQQIKNLGVDPVSADMSSSTDYMTFALGGGGKIVVNVADDLSVVLENISAVLKDRSVAPSFSDFLAKLDYIKFDAGNKVVYKLRGDTSDKNVSAR